jgi:hypothetical protein
MRYLHCSRELKPAVLHSPSLIPYPAYHSLAPPTLPPSTLLQVLKVAVSYHLHYKTRFEDGFLTKVLFFSTSLQQMALSVKTFTHCATTKVLPLQSSNLKKVTYLVAILRNRGKIPLRIDTRPTPSPSYSHSPTPTAFLPPNTYSNRQTNMQFSVLHKLVALLEEDMTSCYTATLTKTNTHILISPVRTLILQAKAKRRLQGRYVSHPKMLKFIV